MHLGKEIGRVLRAGDPNDLVVEAVAEVAQEVGGAQDVLGLLKCHRIDGKLLDRLIVGTQGSRTAHGDAQLN